MLDGLMQQAPLLISGILRHASAAHAAREIVSRLVDEPLHRYTVAQFARRTSQAAHMLTRLGVKAGDLVTSLAWNTHRHLELFFAVPGLGAALHTANPRLSDEHILYTINHAGSRILLFDTPFLPLVERIRDRLDHIDSFILLTADGDGSIYPAYDALLIGESEAFDWPNLDENSGAFLCYTSGTTGDPKGVLYSHRSTVLHALAGGLPSAFDLSAFDVVMPCQSLYHATAWGMPFAALINGCKIVLPCDKLDGASIQKLVTSEGVTASGGVPTIWTMYLEHLRSSGESPRPLERIFIGGSALPRAMSETFLDVHGVAVRQIWGLTETSPIGVVSAPTPDTRALGDAGERDALWTRQGRLQFGVELKLVDAETGAPLPHDGASAGNLLVRGPWTIERYFRATHSALDTDGWFDTGDIATLSPDGFLRITDRSKDVIKSGGEWISSIDIENFAVAHPAVKFAAVIGVPHPKWEERPVLIVEKFESATLSEEEMLAFLMPSIARWWMPDAVLFEPIPLTSTGKIDKKLLRKRHAGILSGLESV